LSDSALSRLAAGEAMTVADYGAALARRRQIRETFAALARSCDGAVTLAATGPAPLGLGSTGNPVFAVPGSILGVPTVSLPVLSAAGLPQGLRVVGFDARLFAGCRLAERPARGCRVNRASARRFTPLGRHHILLPWHY
jgi:Asp-tRNA(Asn)/Glu-tRNA(Gln) amidotransferase A subunit family amidase